MLHKGLLWTSHGQARYVVQIVLKTNDEDQRDSLKNFISQAHVDRRQAVNLILSMKRRGHRAYMRINEDGVR